MLIEISSEPNTMPMPRNIATWDSSFGGCFISWRRQKMAFSNKLLPDVSVCGKELLRTPALSQLRLLSATRPEPFEIKALKAVQSEFAARRTVQVLAKACGGGKQELFSNRPIAILALVSRSFFKGPKMNDEHLDYQLKRWKFDPESNCVRLLKGADGRDVIQMRVDLGILQLETSGRPDGTRPEGFPTLLDSLLHAESESPRF